MPSPSVRTFLIADVRGYTAFTKEHGDEEGGRLASAFAGLAREVVVACEGEVVELRGDEALCVFGSARQAIRGAVELQRRFRVQTHDGPAFSLPIGIGLDSGEAVPIEGGYRGSSLNTAARLCSLARPGQILATETVVALAQRIEGIRFLERRAVRLKGLEKPVRLIEVVPEIPLPPLPALSTPPRPRARRRRMLGAAGVGAALVVAIVSIAVVKSGGSGPPIRVAANSVATVDGGRVTGQSHLGGAPSAMTSGAGAAWIASETGGTVSRLDLFSGSVTSAALGGIPGGVAQAAGSVWVTKRDGRALVQINPDTLAPVQSITVGNGPGAVAVGREAVWVANSVDGTLSRFDLARGSVTDTIPVGATPDAVAVGAGAVWVADEDSGTVVRVDPVTRTPGTPINVGNRPSAVVVGDGAVWVANSRDGTVSRIDPATNAVGATIDVGDEPSALAVERGAVWVASSGSGSITRIDTKTNEPRVVALGSRPVALTAAGGKIYASTVRSLTGHRGGVLRVETAPPYCRCVDPALALGDATEGAARLVFDGLVTYRHAQGAAGQKLVPNLALGLAQPTDGGRTYRFQLRAGLRYSDGSPVRASDFRSSIERDYAVNPFSTTFRAIAGAASCRVGRRCDLSRGIVTDNDTRAITIHLGRPDPDLLHELALLEASLVPATTPLHPPPGRPIVGTGPYRVASFDPEHQLRLVRNMHFKVWSPEARPDGHADEIRLHLTTRVGASIKAVEQGAADLVSIAFRGLTPARQRGVFTRDVGRFHTDQQPGTSWFFLNSRVAPFSDVRVRRALNFAVDRSVLVSAAGGLDAITCQVVPPNLPGYRPYCPYTRNANDGGRWTGPDMARARSLVAASGTAGMRVEVATNERPVPLGSGRYLVSVLRRLGYRASVRVIPEEKYGGVVADSRNRVQLGLNGWIADQLTASNFLEPIMTCAAFVPNRPTNSNLSEYCNPAIDSQIKEATELQTSDPARAKELWAQIDRALVDRAVVVPISTPRSRVLVSARVGNYGSHFLWGTFLDQLWVR